jgi:glycosyltransferase involved in cell wall biosynthesis
VNIAFVTIGFDPLRTSGLDISGERLVRGLLARGHRVTVLAGQREPAAETIQHPHLQIVRLRLGRTNWIGWGWRVARALRRARALRGGKNFDVVHFWDVYFAWAYRGAFVASLQHAFSQRIATSTNVRIGKRAYYWLAMQLAEKPALRRATRLLAGSAASRDAYLREYRLPPGKVALARHGIDTGFFQRVPDTTALRLRLGIAAGERVLLYSGFFTPRKGLEYLAAALRQIAPAPRLILTGRWSDGMRAQFFGWMGDLGGRVIEAGFVPDEEMPAYFSLADLYVSPSLLEGFGLPIAEALACGTPAVAFDAGSVGEVIGPGGALVPAGDAASLANAAAALLADDARRRELGELGRAHVLANFSVEAMVEAMLRGYGIFGDG